MAFFLAIEQLKIVGDECRSGVAAVSGTDAEDQAELCFTKSRHPHIEIRMRDQKL
jgi:hypothetical protein